MKLGPAIKDPKPEQPEWIPHPNGRKHFWLNTKTGGAKYAPPSPYGEPPPRKSGNPEMASNSEPD